MTLRRIKYWILSEVWRLDQPALRGNCTRNFHPQIGMRTRFQNSCKTEDKRENRTKNVRHRFFRTERLCCSDHESGNNHYYKYQSGGKAAASRSPGAPRKNILKTECYFDFRDEKALAQSRLRYSKIFSLFKRASCFPSSYALLTPIGSV